MADAPLASRASKLEEVEEVKKIGTQTHKNYIVTAILILKNIRKIQVDFHN